MRKPAGIIIPAGSVRAAESQDMMRNGICLPQEKPDQLLVDGSVGLVPHGKIQPGFFVHNAFFMGKGIKACFSVIGSHTALAKASEAHLTGSQMNDGIIDAPTPKAAAGGDPPGNRLI